jgi:hypothetical protein
VAVSARAAVGLALAACLAACAAPSPPAAPAPRALERAARLVRLTAAGPVPAAVVVGRGDDLVLLSERPDGPVALVLSRGDPRGPEGRGRPLADVPLGRGELAVVRCAAPGECTLEVRPATGEAAALRVVVEAR